MGVFRAALCVSLLSAGCAQLFGLQETTGAPDPDASPGSVTMQVQRISVGPTAARTPYDVSQLAASFLVPDGSPAGFMRVPATAAGDTWSAEIPDGTPAMEITLGLDLPDTFRRLYALPQRNIKLLYGIYEQPDAVAAPPGGSLTVTLALPSPSAAGESFQLYAVGAWANHGLAPTTDFTVGGTAIGPLDVPYDATTWGSTSGRPLTRITSSDEVLGLRYVGAQLTGAAEFPAFDQGDAATPITATMTAVSANPMDVHVAPADIDQRLAMPTPKGTTLTMNWSVNAAPGWEIANGTGPQLQAGSVALADSGALALPFGNPFAAKGWRSVFTWSSHKARTFAVPALQGLPHTFYCGLNEIAEVGPGLTIDTPAALPVLVSIDQMPLATDGQDITLDPAKPVELSLVADRTDALYYQFNVYELRVDAAQTGLETHVAYVAVTQTPTVTIPNDVFAADKTYFIRAHAIKGGFPNFAIGDFWARDLPYAVGFLDAGVFTVHAP